MERLHGLQIMWSIVETECSVVIGKFLYYLFICNCVLKLSNENNEMMPEVTSSF